MSQGFVAVQISGQEYKIRSDSEDESLVRIAGYVDRAMKRVREGTGTVDSLDVAVLTCLNLARDILTLRDLQADASRSGIEEDRLRALIERVEAAAPAAARDAGAAPMPQSDRAEETIVLGEETVPSEAREAQVRTLELPSAESLRAAESLREPAAEAVADPASSAESAQGPVAPQRAAAGGRDRAS